MKRFIVCLLITSLALAGMIGADHIAWAQMIGPIGLCGSIATNVPVPMVTTQSVAIANADPYCYFRQVNNTNADSALFLSTVQLLSQPYTNWFTNSSGTVIVYTQTLASAKVVPGSLFPAWTIAVVQPSGSITFGGPSFNKQVVGTTNLMAWIQYPSYNGELYGFFTNVIAGTTGFPIVIDWRQER